MPTTTTVRCGACGQQTAEGALRCRHCNAAFVGARAEPQVQMRERRGRLDELTFGFGFTVAPIERDDP